MEVSSSWLPVSLIVQLTVSGCPLKCASRDIFGPGKTCVLRACLACLFASLCSLELCLTDSCGVELSLVCRVPLGCMVSSFSHHPF